jgi:hypothetical protein
VRTLAVEVDAVRRLVTGTVIARFETAPMPTCG